MVSEGRKMGSMDLNGKGRCSSWCVYATHTPSERGSKPVGKCEIVHQMVIDGSVVSFSSFSRSLVRSIGWSTHRQIWASSNTKIRLNVVSIKIFAVRRGNKRGILLCVYILMCVCERASKCTRSHFSVCSSFSSMEFFALLFAFNIMLRFNRNTSNIDCKEHKEHVDDWAFFSRMDTKNDYITKTGKKVFEMFYVRYTEHTLLYDV